ncbi:hypothetical protein AOLI_G00231390 [Acnodon oligacanthus]
MQEKAVAQIQAEVELLKKENADDYETDTKKLSSAQMHLCEEICLGFEEMPLFPGDLRAKVVVSTGLGANCKLGTYR